MNLWNQFVCVLLGHKWAKFTVWFNDEGDLYEEGPVELRICKRCYDVLELPSAPWEADSLGK